MASPSRSNSIAGDFTAAVKFEGFLEKHGKLTGSFLVKKYWCVLDDYRFRYYKNANKTGSCSGFIDMSRVQSVLKASKGFGFNVQTHSGTQTFVASSAEIRDQWVKALQDIMSAAGRRIDTQRHSIISCASVYEANSDDESAKVSASPKFDPVSEVEPAPDDPYAGNGESGAAERGTADNRVEVSPSEEDACPSTFTYMNAADVAAMLGDGVGEARVKSDHVDEVEDAGAEENRDSTEVQSSTRVRAPASDDVLPDSVLEPALDSTRKDDEFEGVSAASVIGSVSSPVSPSNTASAENGQQPKPASNENTGDKKVQLRRPSLSNNELEPATPASALHVVEIHIDTNVRPTIYPELQFDQLPTDSGSAVQRLKQFLEIDGSVDLRSSTKMPAAVQPGKAFDSLKYFLSSMD